MNRYQKLAIILSFGFSLMGCGGVGTEEGSDSLPVANDDMLTLVNGALYTKPHRIAVLKNDKPDGKLDVNSVEIITPPQYGIATPKSNGEVEYEPSSSPLKADSFVYTVKDKNGNYSNPATVSISVIEHISAFIMTVDTRKITTFGTSDTQFQIPTNGIDYNYNYNVDCGNGSSLVIGRTGNHTCNYATPGEYTISITGKFPQIYFPNPPVDNNKLISIEQWGGQKWKSMDHAFQFCINMTSNATDIPDLSLVDDMQYMFLDASSFNQNIGKWNVSNVRRMDNMLSGAVAFSTSNYDSLLNGWFALPSLKDGVVFSAENTKYSSSSGESRGLLISTYHWDITDGGLDP